MNSVLIGDDEPPGFSFRNCRRNENLINDGFKPPKETKTGTTIVGLIFKDGVVLGTDTRATSGGIVMEKECQKLYYIQDNIFGCGAGTAADMQMTLKYVSANMTLQRLNTNRKFVPVAAAVTFAKRFLFRANGRFKCWLIFGGVDNDGPHIWSCENRGSSSSVPYSALGSGQLPAMSVLESRWRPDLSEEEGIEMIRDAVRAGIFNDLGSGSMVDICVIKKNYHKFIRKYDLPIKKEIRSNDYTPQRGTTGILSTKTFAIDIVDEKVIEKEDMEVD